ncbi:MAG: hypothetical protein AB7U95_27965 [Reyranella sp.]
MTRVPWFRFYSEVLHDGKIQRLAIDTRWGWAMLLALANEGEPRGRLPKDLADTAYALHMTEADASKLITELQRAGLIDKKNGRLVMHNWDKRQPESDDVTARVRKHRESKKGKSGNVSGNVSSNRDAVTGNVLEGEGDKEEDPETDPEIEEREGSRDRAPEPQPPRGPEIAKDWAEVQAAYEATIGPMLPADQQRLGAYCRKLPKEWVLAAIAETGGARDPGWPYLDKILRRCVNTSKPPSGSKKAPEPSSARGQLLERARAAAPSR